MLLVVTATNNSMYEDERSDSDNPDRQVMNRLYYVDALSSLAVDLVDNNVAMASNGLPNHHHRGEYRYTVPIYL